MLKLIYFRLKVKAFNWSSGSKKLRKKIRSFSFKLRERKIKYGIYLKNFLRKNLEKLEAIEFKKKKNKIFLWIIVVKRRNFFLTFLNKKGNVILKANSGWYESYSTGEKKGKKKKKNKAKFTGYAINLVCKEFYEKIHGYFLKYWINVYKRCDKLKYIDIYDKIKKFIPKKINFFKHRVEDKKIKSKKLKFLLLDKQVKYELLLRKKSLKKKSMISKIIKESKKFKNILSFYNYIGLYKYRYKALWKTTGWYWEFCEINVHVHLRSVLSSWVVRFANSGFRYGMCWVKRYVMSKTFVKMIEKRIPISHSRGLRIKKQRRL